jgi:hypothetical protein
MSATCGRLGHRQRPGGGRPRPSATLVRHRTIRASHEVIAANICENHSLDSSSPEGFRPRETRGICLRCPFSGGGRDGGTAEGARGHARGGVCRGGGFRREGDEVGREPAWSCWRGLEEAATGVGPARSRGTAAGVPAAYTRRGRGCFGGGRRRIRGCSGGKGGRIGGPWARRRCGAEAGARHGAAGGSV